MFSLAILFSLLVLNCLGIFFDDSLGVNRVVKPQAGMVLPLERLCRLPEFPEGGRLEEAGTNRLPSSR